MELLTNVLIEHLFLKYNIVFLCFHNYFSVTTIRRGGQPRPSGEERPVNVAPDVSPHLKSPQAVRADIIGTTP